MPQPHVIIVGTGIGGLTCTLELARAGYRVTAFESAPGVGGKLRQIHWPGFDGIDSGPTVFTMRWVFDALFEDLGLDLDAHLGLRPLDLLARHGWPDASRLDLYADIDRTVDALSDFAGASAGEQYRKFCADAARTFDTLYDTYMHAERPTPVSLTGRIARRNWRGLAALHPFHTLWSALTRTFDEPRLHQLFGRYATYCGGSPFAAPATLMLIAHAERRGVWLVEGGMRALATTFADLARAAGAEIRCASAVAEILFEGPRASGVRLASGEDIRADAIVFNGDVNALATGCLGGTAARHFRREAVPANLRSQSAITWSAIAHADSTDLAPHTVAFGPDYAREFDDVFKRGHPPSQPTIYVHAPDRPADGHAPTPPDEERLFLLMNAPANGDEAPYNSEAIEAHWDAASAVLAAAGFPVRLDRDRTRVTTPADFAKLFPATGGALYGRAPHGWQASFARLGSQTPCPGLYLAGGSVHPGPGVPMATLSGRLAAATVSRSISPDS